MLAYLFCLLWSGKVRTKMCMKIDPRVPSSYGTSAWEYKMLARNQVFTVGKNIWAALKNAKVLLN